MVFNQKVKVGGIVTSSKKCSKKAKGFEYGLDIVVVTDDTDASLAEKFAYLKYVVK